MGKVLIQKQERDAILVARKLSYVAIPASGGLIAFGLWNGGKFWMIFGAGILVSLASLISGSLVGFLFGIPKTPESLPRARVKGDKVPAETSREGPADQQGALRRNTNIEEISDWLTKIIVGLGIYELKGIPDLLRRLAHFLAPAFGSVDGAGAVAITLCLAFTASGFLLGYLLTVLFITQALVRANPTNIRVDVEQRLREDASAAEVVESVTATGEAGPTDALRQQIISLASRYERERAARSPGPERTRVMEEVTREIRRLALAAYPMLDELSKADSAGQRLAAIAFLQIRPRPEYIDWLSARIAEEVPFVKYQAALGLLNAVRSFAQTHKEQLRKAIQNAKADLEKKRQTRADEYLVLQDAENELG